jgi:chemotaxis protein methyltransferase CheR
MIARAADGWDGEAILRQFEKRTGLALGNARRRDALAALAKAARARGIADTETFLRRLRTDARLFEDLICEITVGETHFFREPAQIEAIRRTILPELARSKAAGLPLRFWSAGCATGEEAYTLAMLAEEAGLSDRTTVLATDISETALAKARAAEYGRWSLRHIPEGRFERFFAAQGNRLKIDDGLRRSVRFERLNLASDCYPALGNGTSGLDLILCRNVMIYFEKTQIERVAQRLYGCLRFGGWLVTGPSDPPLWPHAPFETVIVPGAVLYRRESVVAGRLRPRTAGPRAARGERPGAARDHGARPRRRAGGSVAAQARFTAPSARFGRSGIADRPPALREDEWIAEVARLVATADQARAKQAADLALRQFPLSTSLHYQRAMMLMELGQLEEAASALRRVLFLDRSLAAAHFALGTILMRQADTAAACRSLETAVRLSRARPPLEAVPMCDGQSARELRDAARAQIARMRGTVVEH